MKKRKYFFCIYGYNCSFLMKVSSMETDAA